jgi:hypothetical protein
MGSTFLAEGEDLVLAINAGGGTVTDASGQAWSADSGATGGAASPAIFAVDATEDDLLYSNHRSGAAFSYALPLDGGEYRLRLHFAEPIRQADGQRLFDIAAEGTTIVDDFDLHAEQGLRAAAVHESVLEVTDGTLNLAFQASAGNALVSGIEIIRIGDATQPPPPGSPTAPSGATVAADGTSAVRVSWTDASNNEQNFLVERRLAGSNASFVQVASVAASVTSFVDHGLDPAKTYEYRVRARNASGASAYTVAGLASAGGSADFTQITWTNRNSQSPEQRVESMHAVVDGKLYVFGGFSGANGPIKRSDVYDPASNTWTRIADLPERITHVGVATVGRDVYFASAYVGTGPGYAQEFTSPRVWKYNVDANAYTAVTPLPVPRASGGLVYLDGYLHYFGGSDNTASRADRGEHWRLKVDGGTEWEPLAGLNDPRTHAGYVAYDGKIWMVGGQHSYDETLTARDTLEMYDPATNTWTVKAALPRALSHVGGTSFVMGSRLIVVGGEFEHLKSVSTVHAYDFATDTWETLTALPFSTFSGVAVEIDGILYHTTGSAGRATYMGTPILP